jgi:L-threonylcarbamoyladenylate synthase
MSADEAAAPRAPGMKYRHYAPAAPLVLFSHDSIQGKKGLLERLREAQQAGKKIGAIVSVEVAALLPDGIEVSIYGSNRNPAEAATGLYQALRWFDTHPVDIIFAEGVLECGIGRALMNRLCKAASSVGEE